MQNYETVRELKALQNLERLTFGENTITPDYIDVLGELQNLERLDLHKPFKSKDIKKLKKLLPGRDIYLD